MERQLASIQKILKLEAIEGADKIELATILGWQVVVKKGEFKVDDLCIYFETDSLIPFTPWSEFLFKNGRTGTVRLKTVKLRGQISQGLALPTSIITDDWIYDLCPSGIHEGEDATAWLKITKYEPEIPAQLQGICKSTFPSWIPKTDETRIQAAPWLLTTMTGKQVYITEKIDGSSMTVYLKDGVFGVCSRNMDLIESDTNTYWKVARALDLETKMRKIAEVGGFTNFALQGECYGKGVAGNKYKLVENQNFACFNIYDIDKGVYADYMLFNHVCETFGIPVVPLIAIETLDGTVMDWVKKSNGQSELNVSVLREGIVVRGLEEEMVHRYGRFSFKVVSPEFLLKNGE